MATIEPRLIHLLNSSVTPQLPHADLPPLQSFAFPSSADRPLPLEPHASHLGDQGGLAAADAPPVFLPHDEGAALAAATAVPTTAPSPTTTRANPRLDRTIVNSTVSVPLRLLLAKADPELPSHSVLNLLDDGDGSPSAAAAVTNEAATKKRHRAGPVQDDYVQLPQPVKKQRASNTPLPFPPIINGLHEPPPDAALFPPITDGEPLGNLRETATAADAGGDKASVLPIPAVGSGPAVPAASRSGGLSDGEKPKSGVKSRKKSSKPRRKWSDQETRHLLLGVSRHGVGKWTNILEDPDFKFDERTAGDLKDRFRTCCPDELRKGKDNPGGPLLDRRASGPLMVTGIGDTPGYVLETILNGTGGVMDVLPPDDLQAQNLDLDTNLSQRRSRAHRKKLEDLAELGIRQPFKKSDRRERRPFTEKDDEAILRGLHLYGPAWTKIQRDPRFNLSSRQPIDLRDRVRNKYPDVYRGIEKTLPAGHDQAEAGTWPAQLAPPTMANAVLEPSVSTTIEYTLGAAKPTAPAAAASSGSRESSSKQVTKASSREDMLKFPLSVLETNGVEAQPLVHSPGPDLSDMAAGGIGTGEMDIARLLLDDHHRMSHTTGGPRLAPHEAIP